MMVAGAATLCRVRHDALGYGRHAGCILLLSVPFRRCLNMSEGGGRGCTIVVGQ